MPLSHLTLTVSHLPTSTSFFLSCLQPLGYQFIGRHDDYIGFGQKPGEPADFWITEQKPGSPAGAAHVAFPAPSKDAVGSFFISALKAGGKLHGEPKTRDSVSGYYSAAVVDFDGNSIEAVFRPSNPSSAKSEVSTPALPLLENGSVVSKASKAKTERTPSPKSEAKSHTSKAISTVERPAEKQLSTASQSAPSPTYIVNHTTHTTQKTDDGKTAKTIVGTLLGAAAGAAIAYAMSSDDSKSENTAPPQYSARELLQLPAPSRASSQVSERRGYPALEAPPPGSTYASSERPSMARSISSKNPRASTVYEGTEFVPRGAGSVYMDQNGRRASEGSVYSGTSDIPLRAIEYPPPLDESRPYPCNPSTLISSFPEKSYAMDKRSGGSTYSSSTIKAPSKANHSDYRQYSHSTTPRSSTGKSQASSTHTARQVPLPESSIASSYRSGAKSKSKSGVSARDVPLPESVVDYDHDHDFDQYVTPDDSISQIDGPRSTSHSRSLAHRSAHASNSGGSRASKHSSKFDEPVRPSDSVSQISSHSRASQRTARADGAARSAVGGSKAGSHMGSRWGSQVA